MSRLILEALHARQQLAIENVCQRHGVTGAFSSVDVCIRDARVDMKEKAVGRIASALYVELPSDVLGKICIRDQFSDKLHVSSSIIHPLFKGYPMLVLENIWGDLVELNNTVPIVQLCFIKTVTVKSFERSGKQTVINL